jgi:ribosomal protein L31E
VNEMAQEFKEKTITVNLKQVFSKPAGKRAVNAKSVIIQKLKKETRLTDYKISNKVNEALWARGKYTVPRIIVLKVVNEKGKGIILLPTEKYEPKQDKKKETKTAEKKEEKTEEKQKVEPVKKEETKKTEKAKQEEKK